MAVENTFAPFDLEGPPFGGKRRLFNVVPVQFRTNFLKHKMNAQQLHLRPGDDVIYETSKGPVIARVTGHVRREVLPAQGMDRVLRRATEQDIKDAERNEDLERDAYRFGLQRVQARALPMKLVRAQYMQDGSRIVFHFSAEGRIDFRDLVKDLAHRFRTRIEMHQIGVRDGARMLGGIGSCGRELCCSTFLEDFAPVSIRMAKDQGLTLNPTKVSGMCGRLMCCLVYEQQLYRRMRKRLPRAGKEVMTPDGKGKVIELDVINQRVGVLLEDMNRRTFANEDVVLYDPNAPAEAVDAGTTKDAEYLWDDESTESTESEDDASKRRRGRRRSRSRRSRTDGKASEDASAKGSDDSSKTTKDGEASGGKPSSSKAPASKESGEKESNSGRRRRRSRRRKPSDGKKGGSEGPKGSDS